MKITFLGTGNAQATACYNTCFVMEEAGKCLLVDGGGGNLLLRRLQDAGYKWQDMRDIIVTHKHIDHLLGIVWMQRMICQNMARGKYEGEARLYAHEEVIRILHQMAEMLLTEKERKFIDERFFLIEVKDGETREIIGQTVQFFDIHSTKAKQFGFAMTLKDGRKIACCGDEPYCEAEYEYVKRAVRSCSTRRSASIPNARFLSPTRRTTPRSKMHASWRRNSACRTSCSTTRKTRASKTARRSIPKRAGNITMAA